MGIIALPQYHAIKITPKKYWAVFEFYPLSNSKQFDRLMSTQEHPSRPDEVRQVLGAFTAVRFTRKDRLADRYENCSGFAFRRMFH